MPTLASAIQAKDIAKFNAAIVVLQPSRRGSESTHNLPRSGQNCAQLYWEIDGLPTMSVNGLFGFAVDDEESEEGMDWPSCPPELSGHETFVQVRKQVEGIRKLLFSGNRAAVDKAVGESSGISWPLRPEKNISPNRYAL